MSSENFDIRELDKFNALASRWWDPNSEFKPLHEINPLRLNYIIQHSNGLTGKKVLDVGCGGGILSESMAQAGAHVTGIDMGEAALGVARLHKYESGVDVEYIHCTAEQLASEKPAHYDVVTCMEMLEHVPDPSSVVKACASLVKPGGMVFFSTINRNLKAYALAIVGAEYILKLLPKGTHEYAKFIRPAELSAWVRAAELDVQDLMGMSYNPLTQRYSLGRDTQVNYLMTTQRT